MAIGVLDRNINLFKLDILSIRGKCFTVYVAIGLQTARFQDRYPFHVICVIYCLHSNKHIWVRNTFLVPNNDRILTPRDTLPENVNELRA